MKLRQTTMILILAFSVVPGCRSASLARQSTSSSDITVSNVAQPNQESVTASAASIEKEPVESADSSNDAIQQVSALENSVSPTSATLEPVTAKYNIHAAIETALAQNPELIALRQNENVGLGVLGVAQTYPFNPFVQVQATPLQWAPNQATINEGSGTTSHYVLLMQQIQLGNQQQYREEAASASLNGIRWNILQAELLNVAQTERLYFVAVYQQGLRDLANLNAENNRQLLSILEVQQQAGQATAADVAIVRLDVRSTKQQQRIAEANYETALLDLKRHLCLPPDSKIDLDQNVLKWNWKPATTAELTSMATNRPDVQAARADAEAARANTSLANASRIPDVQLGPYYQRTDTGVTFLGFRAQMDLPVINDGTPLLRQREAEYCQRVAVSQQLAMRAHLEAEAAAQRYERALTLQAESVDGSLTSVPVELQRLEEQFKANEVDILRVIQARNSLLQSQRADLDALNELMQAAVAVTAASGLPLESLSTK